jgi:DNA modification methylase
MTPYYQDEHATIYHGDCREILPNLDDIGAIVTSPPYWALRDYGDERQIGGELTPDAYIRAMQELFTYALRSLCDDGTAWINLGDSYAASGKGGGGTLKDRKNWRDLIGRRGWRSPPPGYKRKDLTLCPFQVASALRGSGWFLRSTIVWEKVSPHEPTREDRPSNCHEYLFLMAKSEDYRYCQNGFSRSVVRVAHGERPNHPATMPIELARRCIIGSDTTPILDPFMGSGTTLRAAKDMGRNSVGIELDERYCEIAANRLRQGVLFGAKT